MPHDEVYHELPDLSDEDIKLLHDICIRASTSHEPPYKALFAAYDHVLSEEKIEPAHDGVVFRFLMRVGESSKKIESRTAALNYVDLLRQILETNGITVLDDEELGEEDDLHIESPKRHHAGRVPLLRRRVSLDDVENVETRSNTRHAAEWRSPSADHQLPVRSKPSNHQQNGLPRSSNSNSKHKHEDIDVVRARYDLSEVSYNDDHFQMHNIMQVQPTYEELLDLADAFADTTSTKVVRRCLGTWLSRYSDTRQFYQRMLPVAKTKDQLVLTRQALDMWRTKRENVRGIQFDLKHYVLGQRERKLRDNLLNLRAASVGQRDATATAKLTLLKLRYFKNWMSLAVKHATDERARLTKCALSNMSKATKVRADQDAQAQTHWRERSLEKYYHAWFWRFCQSRVQGWHEDRTLQFSLGRLKASLENVASLEDLAHRHRAVWLPTRMLKTMKQLAERGFEDELSAANHFDTHLLERTAHHWSTATRLKRPEVKLVSLVRHNRLERYFTLLHDRALQSQQARQLDRQRLLKTAWCSWNDALRYRALSSKINDRCVTESLYRWVLQERLAVLMRSRGEKLSRRLLLHWQSVQEDRIHLAQLANTLFQQTKDSRSKMYSFVKLNNIQRSREDQTRTAIEFRNAHLLPQVFSSWLEVTQVIAQREKWATDARFYFVCTNVLKVWRANTTDHQHKRKRAAYTRIRIRVKTRLARTCLSRLQASCVTTAALDGLLQEQLQLTASRLCLDVIAKLLRTYQEREMLVQQATGSHRQHLLTRSFVHLTTDIARAQEFDATAQAFRYESELAILSSVFRKIQWHHFTAARHQTSADALILRFRDAHARQMLRHWSYQAQGSRRTKSNDGDPDSPSLRPASRAASRSSILVRAEDEPLPETILASAVPAYLRTPSRLRRSTRFRPLSTPAGVTPFAFDSAYLTAVALPSIKSSGRSRLTSQQDVSHVEDPAILGTPSTPLPNRLRTGVVPVTPLPLARGRLAVEGNAPGTIGTTKSVRFARTRS